MARNTNEWLRVTLLIKKLDEAIAKYRDLGRMDERVDADQVADLLETVNVYLNDRKQEVA